MQLCFASDTDTVRLFFQQQDDMQVFSFRLECRDSSLLAQGL